MILRHKEGAPGMAIIRGNEATTQNHSGEGLVLQDLPNRTTHRATEDAMYFGCKSGLNFDPFSSASYPFFVN